MNNQYLSVSEAQAVNALMPGNQVYGVGDKLRNALMAGSPIPTKWIVDGTYGDDTKDGLSRATAFATIQKAIDSASSWDIILVVPKAIPLTATDPTDYAETLIIPATKPGLSIIGYNTGLAQGGMPQIKKGSGTVALLTIRAPGCLISGLGFNGGGSTGGGILLDDDGGVTKTAFGTTIDGCHFKNCKGSSATDGRTGGAIQAAMSGTGSPWQCRITGNRFYKNVCDIVLLGAGAGVQIQDWVIANNIFSDPAASVDVNLWLGGNGINGLVLNNNSFGPLPTLAGSVVRYMILQGCSGVMHNNVFGCVNTLTFKAASVGTAGWVPATVLMANNWGENCTTPFVHTA